MQLQRLMEELIKLLNKTLIKVSILLNLAQSISNLQLLLTSTMVLIEGQVKIQYLAKVFTKTVFLM